eukprot:24422_4
MPLVCLLIPKKKKRCQTSRQRPKCSMTQTGPLPPRPRRPRSSGVLRQRFRAHATRQRHQPGARKRAAATSCTRLSPLPYLTPASLLLLPQRTFCSRPC